MAITFWLENLKGGRRPLGRQRPRYEDNIRVDRREGVDWMHLAQDRD